MHGHLGTVLVKVYLSTVPPFMKPAKVKHLLERFGIITRLFLVEEGEYMGPTRYPVRKIKSRFNMRSRYNPPSSVQA